MNIKTQVMSLLVLLYISYYYVKVKKLPTISGKFFKYIIIDAYINIIFDIITNYTINNINVVPSFINKLCHQIFIFSVDVFIFLLYKYLISLIENNVIIKRTAKIFHYFPIVISGVCVLFGRLYYNINEVANFSYGPSSDTIYISILIYLLIMTYFLIKYWKIINTKKREALLHAIIITMFVGGYQFIFPTSLISSIGITLMIIVLYMSLENHIEYIDKQVGLFNKSGFNVLVRQNLKRQIHFKVISIAIENYNLFDYSIKNDLIINISNYIENVFNLDVYYVEDNCICVIVTDNRQSEIISKLNDRFKRSIHINNSSYMISTQIFSIDCPSDADTYLQIIELIEKLSVQTENLMAYTDVKLGINNRNAFERDIKAYKNKTYDLGNIWCIIVDINNLKVTNDTYGHSYGDLLIATTVKILRNELEDKNLIYRMGGDEFSIIITSKTKKQIVEIFNNAKIKSKNEKLPHNIDVSFAVGYALYNDKIDSSLEDTFKRADKKMYIDKLEMKSLNNL